MGGDWIYFAPCGIGLGHAGRCLSLALKLKKLGHRIIFSTYGDAYQFIKNKGYPVLSVPALTLGETAYGEVDFRLTMIQGPKAIIWFIRQIVREISYISSIKPKLVISDSRLSTVIASRILGVPCILLLHQFKLILPHRTPLGFWRRLIKPIVERMIMEFLLPFWKLSEEILIPDYPPPYTVAKAHIPCHIVNEAKIRFIGPIMERYPDELLDEIIGENLIQSESKPLVYVTFGGTRKEKDYVNKILLKKLLEGSKTFNIIFSRGIPGNSPPKVIKNMWIYDWVPDRYGILKSSSLIVTNSGHGSILEAMMYGLYMILIPTPYHTEKQNHAKTVEKMGLAKVVQQNQLSQVNLIKLIDDILNDIKKLRRAKEVALRVSNFNGTKNAINIILNYFNKSK